MNADGSGQTQVIVGWVFNSIPKGLVAGQEGTQIAFISNLESFEALRDLF